MNIERGERLVIRARGTVNTAERPRDEIELSRPCEKCGCYRFRLWGTMFPNAPPAPPAIGRGDRMRWPVECVECEQMRLSRDEAVRDRVRALGGAAR